VQRAFRGGLENALFPFGLNAQVPVVGASLVRALLVGGNVNNGRNDGARYCNVNNAPSNSNWNYCAAQSFGIANLFWRVLSHAAVPEVGAGRNARAKIGRTRRGK